MSVYFYVDPQDYANEDLVIGTPEYNKVRYGQGEWPIEGKPSWMRDMEFVLKQKAQGNYKYRRASDGRVFHPADNRFNSDVANCISRNLHLKTKSFEYRPKTGEVYLYGQYVAHVDKTMHRIDSFTLKHINTKESRYRLRAMGINLTSVKSKTYWTFTMGKSVLEEITLKYESIEGLRSVFRHVFPSIVTVPEEGLYTYKVICELNDKLTYPIWANSVNQGNMRGVSETYRETDIFDPGHSYLIVGEDTQDGQMVLEL